MNPNLKWKAVFISAVVLICIYGLLGLPSFPTSRSAVADNFKSRIQLGLDLRGGSHLVLQVQVQEAIGTHCDQAIDSLKDQLHKQNLTFGEVRRVDDTHFLILNIAPDASAALHDMVQNQFPDWSMAPAAGQPNGFLLSMKATVVASLQTQTMEQAIETIRRRIDALGLTAPNVQPTGRGQ